MQWRRGVWLLVLAAVPGSGVAGQETAKDQQSEQTSFGAEAAPGEVLIKKPVQVPDAALQVLRDTLVRGTLNCIKNRDGLTAEQVPASWFVGSEIHLSGPGETDLVVQPADMTRESPPPYNTCLFGAHVVPFWVIRENPSGRYSLLLETYAVGLDVLDSRTNGYRDIQTEDTTAVTYTTILYQMAVAQYQLAEKKTTKP